MVQKVVCIYIIYIYKTTSIYTSAILFSHKKKILLLMTTWMDFEGIMLVNVRQKKTNTV